MRPDVPFIPAHAVDKELLLLFCLYFYLFAALNPSNWACRIQRRYFKTFKERFRQPTVCSLAGQYDNPIPTRFLTPIDCSKISANFIERLCILHWDGICRMFPFPLSHDLLFSEDILRSSLVTVCPDLVLSVIILRS